MASYRRKLSREDVATGSILIEEVALAQFPPPMQEFAVDVAGQRFATRIVAEDCDVRAAAAPALPPGGRALSRPARLRRGPPSIEIEACATAPIAVAQWIRTKKRGCARSPSSVGAYAGASYPERPLWVERDGVRTDVASVDAQWREEERIGLSRAPRRTAVACCCTMCPNSTSGPASVDAGDAIEPDGIREEAPTAHDGPDACSDGVTHRGNISQHVQAIPSSGIRRFFDLLASMEGVISLGVGQPDFVTPNHIRQAAIKSIEDGETYYTSNYGLVELRARDLAAPRSGCTASTTTPAPRSSSRPASARR